MDSSCLGPDSHVSCGEVHHSLLGPSSHSHHQSLLISIISPLGRINVGYGANVGSNHTGRAADQEAFIGEGTFLGLSAVVKFPLDTTEAPYSILAAGTDLPPQKISFPFSLIGKAAAASAPPASDETGAKVGATVPPPQPALNQIHPAWILRHSPYTLARSERKYRGRRKSKRHGYAGYEIMR